MLTLQQVAVGPPPLPGGVAAVLRFFFNLPQWFQIAGFIVGVIVAAIVLVLLWRRRAAIVAWIVSRPRGLKIGLAAGVAAVALGFAAFGVVGWDYMQHNNGFCTGCHVMKVPFQRFAGSKHDSLSCHACHQQGMYANVRQLYLWVAERPEKIGKHAKVPTRICATCHVRGDAKQTWQRIASTAGHRTHLESDSSALKNVQCVTCHGLEVHRFVPVDSTCAQAGCHVNVRITLAKMSNQTDAHCTTCHRFTAEVPALATRDSVRGTLVETARRSGADVRFGQVPRRLARRVPRRQEPRGGRPKLHPVSRAASREGGRERLRRVSRGGEAAPRREAAQSPAPVRYDGGVAAGLGAPLGGPRACARGQLCPPQEQGRRTFFRRPAAGGRPARR